MNTQKRLHTLDQIKRAAKAAGSHWFDAAALRYFSSRISNHVYSVPGGALFISSEQYRGYGSPDGPRLYTVRSCSFEGAIDTVGEFQQYETSKAAHAAALKLAMADYTLSSEAAQ
tara:strand:- start:676 stop:1020 length:345 start_codon:yes stop_codon:yes gene_type:complete